MPPLAVRLADRAVIAIEGEEARRFLQAILTQDVGRLSPERALYAALLTPQGKFLFDMILAEFGGAILVDCAAARSAELLRRLMLYRLRAKATLTDRSADFAIWAILGDAPSLPSARGGCAPYAGGVAVCDPRSAEMGWRAILPAGTAPPFPEGDREAYEAARIALGLPDGERDLEAERTLALEANLDLLGAVDFSKGCYIGQEITARTKYRGKVRRRLFPVHVESGELAAGQAVTAGGTAIGDIRSARGKRAIAMLRLDEIESGATAGVEGRPLHIDRPAWMAQD